MKASEGTNAAFSNGLTREKGNSGECVLETISVIRTCLLALSRAGEPTESVLRTVKSFAELSVSDTSSGNSPATIPHNSSRTNARTRSWAILIRLHSTL